MGISAVSVAPDIVKDAEKLRTDGWDECVKEGVLWLFEGCQAFEERTAGVG